MIIETFVVTNNLLILLLLFFCIVWKQTISNTTTMNAMNKRALKYFFKILIMTLFGRKGIKDIVGLDITGKLFPTTDENWIDGNLTDSFIVHSARDCSQLVPTVTEIFVVYIKKLRPNVFKSCGMR